MNTLQVYQILSSTAGDLNRLAVRLREDEITKKDAQAKAITCLEKILAKLK